MKFRILSLFALTLACNGAAGSGRVQIFVEAEETIPEGLSPGTGDEQIVDGWSVEYTHFTVAIGNFRAGRSSDASAALRDDTVWIVDMLALPQGGVVLTEFDAVDAVRWDRFGFDLPNAAAGADTSLAAEGIAAEMIAGGLSLLVEGTLRKPDGQSCLPSDPSDCVPAPEVGFRFELSAGTSFDDCAPEDGDAGFAVPQGGAVQVKPTIHGDHWFFTNITQGAEITERRAQWIADSDLDRDGTTTLNELKVIPAAQVFKPELGYNVSGALLPINTAYDYLVAQARTLGDFQGGGECPTRAPL
jgi:hypothetical protein